MAKFDYRQYYKDYFGIEFDKNYVIHHIDFNKENNDINNLLLLPKKLYSKYMFLLNGLNSSDGKITVDFTLRTNSGSLHTFDYDMMKHLCETMIEVDNWIREKEIMMQSKYYEERYGI